MLLDPELFDAPKVDRASAAVGAEYPVPLIQQQPREIRAVLAGDSGHDRGFHRTGLRVERNSIDPLECSALRNSFYARGPGQTHVLGFKR